VVYFCRDLLQMFVKDLDYFLRGFDTEELREKANNLVLKSTKLLVSLLEAYINLIYLKERYHRHYQDVVREFGDELHQEETR
jgi:hypothetical protein